MKVSEFLARAYYAGQHRMNELDRVHEGCEVLAYYIVGSFASSKNSAAIWKDEKGTVYAMENDKSPTNTLVHISRVYEDINNIRISTYRKKTKSVPVPLGRMRGKVKYKSSPNQNYTLSRADRLFAENTGRPVQEYIVVSTKFWVAIFNGEKNTKYAIMNSIMGGSQIIDVTMAKEFIRQTKLEKQTTKDKDVLRCIFMNEL